MLRASEPVPNVAAAEKVRMNVPDQVMERIVKFLEDLRNPEEFGFSVTEEVREVARQLYFDIVMKQQ